MNDKSSNKHWFHKLKWWIPIGIGLIFLINFMMPTMGPHTHHRLIQACHSQMREIAIAIYQYKEDHGQPPEKLEQLIGNYIEEDKLYCPINKKQMYIYHPQNLDNDNLIILEEPFGSHLYKGYDPGNVNFAFGDGHVKKLSPDQYQQYVNTTLKNCERKGTK